MYSYVKPNHFGFGHIAHKFLECFPNFWGRLPSFGVTTSAYGLNMQWKAVIAVVIARCVCATVNAFAARHLGQVAFNYSPIDGCMGQLTAANKGGVYVSNKAWRHADALLDLEPCSARRASAPRTWSAIAGRSGSGHIYTAWTLVYPIASAARFGVPPKRLIAICFSMT